MYSMFLQCFVFESKMDLLLDIYLENYLELPSLYGSIHILRNHFFPDFSIPTPPSFVMNPSPSLLCNQASSLSNLPLLLMCNPSPPFP